MMILATRLIGDELSIIWMDMTEDHFVWFNNGNRLTIIRAREAGKFIDVISVPGTAPIDHQTTNGIAAYIVENERSMGRRDFQQRGVVI